MHSVETMRASRASKRHQANWPKPAVVDRYDDDHRVILRTNEDRDKGIDHIVCARFGSVLDSNFVDVISP